MARITLRLPDDLHRQLQSSSRQSGKSLNQTIVDALSDQLRQCSEEDSEETPQEKERRRIREALGDLVVDFRPEDYAPLFRPLPKNFDREALFRSMPRLDPPLSQTIIEDREERF